MSYGPNESSSDVLFERTFLSSDFLTGFGYGVQTALYFASASYLWQQQKARWSSLWLLIYITILFSLNTIYGACSARDIQLDYIDNRNYPGGPLSYFLSTTALPVNVAAFVVFFIANVLADGLLVWRCYIIWSSSGIWRPTVMAIPVLMLLSSFSLGVVFTIHSSIPGSSLYSETAVSFGLSYFIISLSLNIILTVLIIVRLLVHRRRINAVMGMDHGKDYTSLVGIVIESAMIYSIFAFTFLITYAINSPINQVFIGLITPAQLISSYLIIYRVAQGRAWSGNTIQKTMTTVQFSSHLIHLQSNSSGNAYPTSETLNTGPTNAITFENSVENVEKDNERDKPTEHCRSPSNNFFRWRVLSA